jgi:hypothetical protein
VTSPSTPPDPQPQETIVSHQAHAPFPTPAVRPRDPERQTLAAPGHPQALRRIAPALGLFFLAPLVAEYLLGNIAVSAIAGMLVLAPMYGGGALLIREAARRTGRGWPAIILLASAYGVLQPGLLDQSLFDPSFEGYDFQSAARIPALGISAHWALTFVAGHAIWSISLPIAIVETLVPDRQTTPWLGNLGVTVTGVVFLLGAGMILADHQQRFLASAPQLAGATAVILALIGAAFAIRPRPRPRRDRRPPNPWLVGVVALVTSNLFFARPETWLGVAIGVALLAVMTVAITRWSRRADWAATHRLALAGGTLSAYAWAGFLLLYLEGAATAANLIGQTVLVLGAVALLLVAGHTARRTPGVP